MKRKSIILWTLLGMGYTLQAQGVMDGFKYAQTDLIGSARYMSMAGAFGALGGDITAVSQNPASIGVYRSSEMVATLNYSNIGAESNVGREGMNKFAFNNMGYVATINQESNSGWANFNFGFAYNRLASFNRTFAVGYNDINTSLTNYIAEVTNYDIEMNGAIKPSEMESRDKYDPYFDSNIPWLTTLGYNGYLIDPLNNEGGVYDGFFKPSLGDKANASLVMREEGSINEYTFTAGANYGHRLYIGASVGLVDISYGMRSIYGEEINFIGDNGATNKGSYTLNNYLSTEGSGVNFKLGIIARPTTGLRLGFAMHTPTAYQLNDYFDASLSYKQLGFDPETGQAITGTTSTPDNAYFNYRLNTPWRLMGSVAYTIGKYGLVSAEYEFTDYKGIKFKDSLGEMPVNGLVGDYLADGHTFKLGGEYRITSLLSARAGYMLKMTPTSKVALNQDVVIETAGTVTQYTLDRNTEYITAGLGYRFGSIFTDLAYVYKRNNQEVLPFSPINGAFPTVNELITSTHSVALTVGFRF